MKKLFRKSEKRHEKTWDEIKKEKDAEYPRKGQSGSGTTHGFSVEARFNSGLGIKEICGIQLTSQWKTLTFAKVDPPIPGVPNGSILHYFPRYFDLLTYEAAQAMRWWFHAEAEHQMLGGLCIETRLVKHKVTYSIAEEAVSHHEHVGGDGGDYPSHYPPTEIPQDPKKIEDKE